MVDPYLDAVRRAHEDGDRMWRELLPEARRRLQFDPLLAAQVSTAVRLVEAEAFRSVTDDGLDAVRHGARLGAALALVIAERPELITGQPRGQRTPAELLALVLGPVLTGYTSGVVRLEDYVTTVLNAFAVEGYEVTRRADRFATLDTSRAHSVRIPLHGRCGVCTEQVTHDVDADPDNGEVLIGPWRHVDARAPHRDDAITDVVES